MNKQDFDDSPMGVGDFSNRVLTRLDDHVQREMSKRFYIISVVMLIAGSIGVLAFIAAATIADEGAIWPYIFLLFAIPFAIGLIMVISIRKNIHNAKTISCLNEFNFYEDHMIVRSIKNNEYVGSSKIYYKDIIKVKQSPMFIYLYISKFQAFAIDKNGWNGLDHTLKQKLGIV